MQTAYVSPAAPYDFHLSMGVLARVTEQVVDYYDGSAYRRVLNDGHTSFLVEAKPTSERNETLELRILHPQGNQRNDWVFDQLRWILATDFDLRPFYGLMNAEAETRRIRRQLHGLKLVRSPNIFEALVCGVTEQQVSLSTAMAVRMRLAAGFGECMEYEGREFLALPSPETAATIPEEDLRALGLTSFRAKAIATVAGKIVEGTLDCARCPAIPTDQAIAELTSLPGIGHWTAEYVVGRGLGRYEGTLANDNALSESLREVYGQDAVNSPADVRRLLGRFEQFSGYAAFYFILARVFAKMQPRLHHM